MSNKSEDRLTEVSMALEVSASELKELVDKMRNVLEKNGYGNKGERGPKGDTGPKGDPGKDAP